MIIYIGKKIRILITLTFILVVGILLLNNADWILKTIYPIHYQELIDKYSDMYDVDPYLVAAIIRNESRFNPDAISRKEARGLMQIAPITGEWASEKLGIENYSEEMLFEPELNIRIGCWYLNILYGEFGDNLQLIIAAYNAGNGNVSRWLDNPEYSSDGKDLDVIPFGETRIYLQRVNRDYTRYRVIYQEGVRGFLSYLRQYTLF
ncbi:lytic transglycosylase domain-containing protein [Alkaliphilus peptidifermentans]|uniref:lytic transglycosylase domain-containing protein n=1 Tax=Alkaliphilus peptidifermentans TaxID=426129 RepID=UPI002E8E0B77|nr:lytic transglycosylase domain-containing protein [Alkaliphilus peptidifermentans]